MGDDQSGGFFSFLDELNVSTPVTEVWVSAGSLAEIGRVGLKRIRVAGRPVGVMVLPDQRLVARELSCKHQGADLSGGPRQGTVLTCPRHAWEFDLATGECLTHPTVALRAHATKIEDGEVYVSSRML
jgi:nitrite reductase/ring-hydroxylating ferredoxin subunit